MFGEGKFKDETKYCSDCRHFDKRYKVCCRPIICQTSPDNYVERKELVIRPLNRKAYEERKVNGGCSPTAYYFEKKWWWHIAN